MADGGIRGRIGLPETISSSNETNVHPSPFFVKNSVGLGRPGAATQ